MENSCEHRGRSKKEPIILLTSGEERVFCSADCVMMEERGKG